MITVRRGVFETNSSSTHSITICSKKQFDDWRAGKIRYNPDTEKFSDYVADDVIARVRTEAPKTYTQEHSYNKFYKSWDELDTVTQEQYIEEKIKAETPYQDDFYTYEDYKRFYQEGCAYTERFFTTEHGDIVTAFGKGGYS